MSIPLSEAAQEWLKRHLVGPDGRERPHGPIIKAKGVSKGTFYAILKGKVEPSQETMDSLADALGAPRPIIRTELLDAPERPGEPRSALGWVDEARAALDQARKVLAPSEPEATMGSVLTVVEKAEQGAVAADKAGRRQPQGEGKPRSRKKVGQRE